MGAVESRVKRQSVNYMCEIVEREILNRSS